MGSVTRESELTTRRVCRFCLTQQTVNLSNIYVKDPRIKLKVPLTVQVMACVAMEIYSSDGMPVWVCYECRLLFQHSYRFKQMCKHAETLLRQYPITGQWPNPLEKPIIPADLLKKLPVSPESVIDETLLPLRKRVKYEKTPMCSIPKKILNSNPVATPEPPVPIRLKKERMEEDIPSFFIKVDNNEELSMDDVQHLIASAGCEEEFRSTTKKPKLLNKSSIRILNKDAEKIVEPRLSKPTVQRDEDGNVAIITEILDPNEPYEQEPDPVKNVELIETNVFPCPLCERSFPLLQLRDIHMVNHSRERSFQCTDCEKSFFSKYDLAKHVLIHSGDKPFKCTVCEKVFTRATLLHRHEKTHTDIPKYICVHCERPFLSKEVMEKHAERHLKNRPYQCKTCSKSFAFKQGLERHEVIHSREQPYPCQYCSISFSTPSKLQRHLTAHAGTRPYPCKFCTKSYLLSHHLTRHLRSHKQGAGSFVCNECRKIFGTLYELIYHSALHATQNLTCPLCKESFLTVDAVTEHIKNHAEGDAFACEFCDLIFMTAERLQEHSEEDHSEEMIAYHKAEKEEAETVKKEENDIDTDSNFNLQQTLEEFLFDDMPDSGELKSGIVNTKTSVVTKQGQRPNKTKQQKLQNTQRNVGKETANATTIDKELLSEDDILIKKEEEEFLSEPSAKIRKVVSNTEAVKSAGDVTFEAPEMGCNAPTTTPKTNKSKARIQIEKIEKLLNPKEITILDAQPTPNHTLINSVLKSLPKGVSVRRKGSATTAKAPASPPSPKVTLNKVSPTKTPQQQTNSETTNTSAPAEAQPSRTRRVTSRRSNDAASDINVKSMFQNKDVVVRAGNKSITPTSSNAKAEESGANPPEKAGKTLLGGKATTAKRITITKAEMEAMTKEGRICLKEGKIYLKRNSN